MLFIDTDKNIRNTTKQALFSTVDRNVIDTDKNIRNTTKQALFSTVDRNVIDTDKNIRNTTKQALFSTVDRNFIDTGTNRLSISPGKENYALMQQHFKASVCVHSPNIHIKNSPYRWLHKINSYLYAEKREIQG
jgi:hypothetical protein